MSLLVKLILTFLVASQAFCTNILYLHTLLSPSHHLWNSALAKELAQNGYNVTFLSVDPPRGKVENLHYIVLEGTSENLYEGEKIDLIEYSKESTRNKFKAAFVTTDYCAKTCSAIYNSRNGIEKILSYPNDFKFDLVINDFTCGPCLLPIVHKFKYPSIIGVTPFLNPPYTHLTIGGHKYPAYVPHYLMNVQHPMTFLERCYNLIIYLIEILQGYCANVLYLHGVLSPSHHIWNRALAKGLADSGHNVTFLSTDKPKGEVKNLHYIILEESYENLEKIMSSKGEDFNIMDYAKESESSKFNAARVLSDYASSSCDAILRSKNGIEKILSYPNDFKFDIVIYDFTCGPCILPIVKKFNYPSIIGVSAFLNPPYTHFLIGGNKYPAYIPHYLLDFKPPMSFCQRFYNFLIYLIEDLSFEYELYPGLEKTVRKHLNFKDMPSLKEIEQKTKLLLLNSDHAIDYPEPLQPNMILVGGLQITEPKELPADIKKFVEGGKKGTVLMSLGTNILSNLLGDEVLTSILKTFESLPEYNFIWKFESEPHELPIKPSKNVMVSKFLPQNDLLAHPNLKAFITHAGGLSTQESLWYGKVMVGIPFIADQYRTIEKSVSMGVAVKLEIAKLNVDIFKKAIKEVIENPSYAENAQKVSRLFQDKPKKPLDTAVWWIEYVLRNPDAPIFKSPTLELGFLASNNYDIYLVIIACLHIIVFLIRALYIKCFGKKDTKKVKTN